MQENSISWIAHEYDHKEKTPDWFWAIGIIAISIIVTSIIKNNFVFAFLIFISSLFLTYYGNRKPNNIEYKINEKGITIHRYFYPYSKLKKFTISLGEDENKIHIQTENAISPVLTMHTTKNENIHEIVDYLSNFLEEDENFDGPITHKIMELIGF